MNLHYKTGRAIEVQRFAREAFRESIVARLALDKAECRLAAARALARIHGKATGQADIWLAQGAYDTALEFAKHAQEMAEITSARARGMASRLQA